MRSGSRSRFRGGAPSSYGAPRAFFVRRALAGAALGGLVAGCGGDPEPTALALQDEAGVLTVITGTFSRTCEEARSIIFECGRWELAVHVKPAAQSGGAKPLASDDTSAESLVSDGGPHAQKCSVVGGTYEQGTIEILEAGADSVTFTIAGTAQGAFDADGTYTASRCK